MKIQKKFFLASLAAALVLSLTAVLFFKELTFSPDKMLKILSDRADLEVKNVLYREVSGNGNKLEIQANNASYVQEDNKAFFDEPKIKLFLSNGKKLSITAKKGTMNTESKDIQISGRVVIDAGSGEQLKTDYLQYFHDDERLYTEAYVAMETPMMLLKGSGMSLSLKDMDMVLFSKVSAEIK